MVKRFTISFSDFCFENYLSEIYTNRSKYVESLVIRGAESMLENKEESKSKYLKLLQEKNNLEEELKKSRFELNKRKESIDNKKAEREKKIAAVRGILASGVLQE